MFAAAIATAALFAYDAHAPIDLRTFGTTRVVPGAQVRDITYASPGGGRVTAYLVIPSHFIVRAGIVYGHWALGDRAEFLPEAIAMARFGFASILPDSTFTRPAQWRDGAPGSALTHPQQNVGFERHAIVDLRRAFDVLVAQTHVSPSKIAYVGHSFDASLGGILGAVDNRFNALVLIAGDGDDTDLSDAFLRGAWHAIDNRTALYSALSKIQIEQYLQAMRPFNADNFVRSIRAPIFMQFADEDAYISRAMALDYVSHSPRGTFVRWYVGGHELNDPQALSDRTHWLLTIMVARGQ